LDKSLPKIIVGKKVINAPGYVRKIEINLESKLNNWAAIERIGKGINQIVITNKYNEKLLMPLSKRIFLFNKFR